MAQGTLGLSTVQMGQETVEKWTTQMVEFQQEPGNWKLTFGIATSGVLSPGMKLEPEHAHSVLWVEFKELLK